MDESAHFADGREGKGSLNGFSERAEENGTKYNPEIFRIHAIGFFEMNDQEESEEIKKRKCVRRREIIQCAEKKAESRL